MSQLEFTSGSAEPSATQFVDVILPLPLPKPFTYRVPNELQNQVIIGSRVVVPFGSRKVHTGIIKEVHDRPPKQYEARYLIDLLDTSPSLNATQLRFFQWMAGYYLCNLGEVVNNALPSGLKISNESFIQLHPNYENTDEVLSWEEELVLQQLETGETYAYEALGELIGASKVSKVIKALIDRQAIIIFDHIKERYVPKIEKRIRLNADLIDQNRLEAVFKQLDKKPKQTDVLLSFLQRVAIYDEPELNEEGVARKELLKSDISPSSLNTLIKNNILEEFSIQISRFDEIEPTKDRPQLSLSQSQARNEVLDQFRELKTVLLQGITGSGKTEIYIDLITEVLESGSQALYLLPEIALTTQIVARVKKVFGDKVGVYHSRFSDNERVEVWQGVQSGKYDFVIGVRSAIFLPFDNLELIIIDEEHESSYKQHDPAPRYHARDSALVLASYHQAKVLLGSATPAIESKYLATQGKYGFVELNDRFADSTLPNISLVNIAKEKKKKKMHGNFSASLIEALNATFKKNEQAIIFQNRRGYAPYLNCNMCGWIPQCDNCSVSLTYHMYQNELKCHYCGFRAAVPTSCEICGAHEMQAMSFGTEQLEEELKLLYPDKRIERMDLDTMKAKTAYEQLITNFTEREIDVIVGTQMVAKGLDFEHVSLVGILDIDRMIHFPDFRAQERAFDISVQVAGRAGRRKTQGEVLIQTFDPEQAILQKVVNHDYNGFYKVELAERKAFFYPPFSRMIKIVLKHRALDVCLEASYKLAQLFRDTIGDKRVFGPAQPIISKIRNRYLQEVYVKIERSANLKKAKLGILEQVNVVKSDQKLKGLRIVVDVDPI